MYKQIEEALLQSNIDEQKRKNDRINYLLFKKYKRKTPLN